VAEIDFSGKGFLSGKKNSVDAVLFQVGDKKNPLFTVSGQWNDHITIHEGDGEEKVETVDVRSLASTPMHVDSLEDQDNWESRKAWAGVIAALNEGNMQKTVDEKSKVEQAQRELRKLEESKQLKWEPLFFKSTTSDPVFERLGQVVGEELHAVKTLGVWKFDREKWGKGVEKPFYGRFRPDGSQL
jgi:hypothetical protein